MTPERTPAQSDIAIAESRRTKRFRRARSEAMTEPTAAIAADHEAPTMNADLRIRAVEATPEDDSDRVVDEGIARSPTNENPEVVDLALGDGGAWTSMPLGSIIELAQAGGSASTAASAPAAAVPATTPFNPLVMFGFAGAGLIFANRSNTPLPELSGKVIDGYLAGATVFIDVNGNDKLDAGEPSTTTDANGGFVLRTNLSGPIVAQGGRDISTGFDFEGTLRAPAGSTVVTPLTALVAELVEQKGLSVSAASNQVMQAIGQSSLAGKIDLTRFDPVAEIAKGTDGALAVQKAGVAIVTMINELSDALAPDASAGALTGVSSGVFSVLALEIAERQLSIAPESLSSTTSSLIDAVLARSEPIAQGVNISKESLSASRVGLNERIAKFEAGIANSSDLASLANVQKNTLESKTYTLQLLHFADAEAGLLASQTAPRLAALVDRFEDQYANSITLAGGDNFIPGPFMAAGTDPSLLQILGVPGNRGNVEIGAVEVAIHNKMGVVASTLGNHEFDLGSNALASAFRPGSGSPGADFVYLSANLDFASDSALNPHFVNTVQTAGLEEASALKGKIAPSAVITEGGTKIGLVGVTTQLLESISSPSGTRVKGAPGRDDMDLLASQLQPVIDDLTVQGVNKIILMSHLQVLGNEKLLATKLSGVDIILAAGSNTRLGDANDVAVAFPGHDASFADTYPLVIKDKAGQNTLLVNTDNEFTYLGRLVVDFDDKGHIVLDSLTANASINGAYAATDQNVAAAWGTTVDQLATTAYAPDTRGGEVKALTDAVQAVISAKDGNVFGYSNVYLEGERSNVRNQETNLGNLSADANAYALEQALGSAAEQTYIVSLKNGGGIRAQIGTISAPKADGTVDKLPPPDGSVSQLDVENSLRFNNQLMAFDTTPEGLKAILEHGVASLGSQGRFPQLGGVSFSYDPDLPAGSRVSDIALVGDGYRVGLFDNGVKLASAPATLTVVTLNFIANNGDFYPIKTVGTTKGNGKNFRYVVEQSDGTLSLSDPVDESKNFTAADTISAAVGSATLLGEQKAFETYLRAFHGTPETAFNGGDVPAALDTRIQNLNAREEDVLSAETTGAILLNASIDGLGDAITLYFDRALDASNIPLASQFSVLAAGSSETVSVTSVQVYDGQVRLRLDSVLPTNASVQLAFRDPSMADDPVTLQALDGKDVLDFRGVTVTNRLSLVESHPGKFAKASATTEPLAGAEISAFDPLSNRLFVTSPLGLQVLSVDSDLKMTLLGTVSLGSNDINSVAVKNGILAVAVAAADKTQPGTVFLLDAGANLSVVANVISPSEPFVRGSVTVGALPDMLVFTPDGTKILVANEGERNTPNDIKAGKSPVDPEGSVSIIDLSPVLAPGAPSDAVPTDSTAGFTAFNAQAAALKAKGVRLFAGEPGFEVARDLEPEYIAISPDGKTAFVTLQENNALAILDIQTGQFTDIVPLGLKSFWGLPFDGSDRDGPGNTTAVALSTERPVFGQYMPDAIASYTGADGRTYYLIANEGDDRDDFIEPAETIRVSSSGYVLDPTAFPNGAALKSNAQIGRLTVSNAPGNRGDTDGDGDIDQILTYGARSFSIINADGRIIFDSGSHMEQFVAAGGVFNAANPSTSGLFDDTRSDNKGPEPEGITVGVVNGRTLAFVGLERGGGGVMVYDVTDPTQVGFVQYLRNPVDVSPEGLIFVPGAVSPSGRSLLFVTNEVSQTVTVFESQINDPLKPGDLMFVSASADGSAPATVDSFAFILLRNIAEGTEIGFSDRNYSASTEFAGITNEAAFIWTADQAYAAGTIVTIQPDADNGSNPISDRGSVIGAGGGLSGSGDTIYAFTGDIAGLAAGTAGAISVDQLLASLNIGGGAAGDVPSAIGAYSQVFSEDNVKYNGPLDASDPAELALLIADPSNWLKNDSTAYAITSGSLFPV